MVQMTNRKHCVVLCYGCKLLHCGPKNCDYDYSIVLYYRCNYRVEIPSEDNYTLLGPQVSHPASLTGIQNLPAFIWFPL